MTKETKKSSSAAETAQTIQKLLKPLPEERADAARLDELRRFFAKLVADGELKFCYTNTDTTNSATVKWNAFLQKQFRAFTSQLCKRIEQGKKTSIRTMLGVIAACPIVERHERVNPDLVYVWLRSLLQISTIVDDKDMRHLVQDECLTPYRDVQYYTLVAIARLANEAYDDGSDENSAERLFQLLCMIPVPTCEQDMQNAKYLISSLKEAVDDEDEDEDEESDDNDSVATNEKSDDDESSEEDDNNDQVERQSSSLARAKSLQQQQRRFKSHELRAHKKALANAWLAVLKLPLPSACLKSALQFLPQNVLSHIFHPLRFADFFIQAYRSGGVISLLALEGLFLLMTKHGLEYPLFYTSLYELVQPSILHVKYRTRFLELLQKCLMKNEMLPAHLVAAFCKRLLRCCLSAPPPAILFCLALCGNLLRKHSECAALIHRNGDHNDEEVKDGEAFMMSSDPYDADINDPTEARALESSLWELNVLSQHYHPAVATLAKSTGTEGLKTPLHNMDDFSRHTYKSLFDQERKRGHEVSSPKKRRKVSNTPLAFVEPSEGLFSTCDVLSGILFLPGR